MSTKQPKILKGRIHSFESLGTVDGPGIRLVVFFQGCPLRCLYCHNPDTWECSGGQLVDAEDILKEYRKNAAFYQKGGITATGGEPLLQMEFLTDLFKKAQAEHIHTCLDTSGITFNPTSPKSLAAFTALMAVTDLVLLDIKEIDAQRHEKLTGASNSNVLDFARWLSQLRKPVWIRHVVIPGLTDQVAGWQKLGEFLGRLHNIVNLDILPYHRLGKSKYDQLGLPYALENVPEASRELAEKATKVIFSAMKATHAQLTRLGAR